MSASQFAVIVVEWEHIFDAQTFISEVITPLIKSFWKASRGYADLMIFPNLRKVGFSQDF